jgi:hypothetical protein
MQGVTLANPAAFAPTLTDDEFWADINEPSFLKLMKESDVSSDQVRFYLGLGMLSVRGRLFRIQLADCKAGPELPEYVRHVTRLKFRKLAALGLHVGGRDRGIIGSYALFFGSSWHSRTGVFSNFMQVSRWARGYKTCTQWVVYLQRRARQALRARRALAVAMALHARLGADSAMGRVDADLAQYILAL